ncbi:MAG: S41 family peptidase [Balneolaceae bacterium]
MTVKKFIAPQIALLFILSSIWLAGVDQVIVQDGVHQDNLHKYLQVQRRIVDNYFGETDLNDLFERSIYGIVKTLDDSTLVLDGTPIDMKQDMTVQNFRDSYNRYEDAYLYVLNNYPDTDMSKAVENSIKEMLSTLDPHSVYIEPEDSERIQEQFAGQFQGIGIQFNILQDTITVITPISGGPSDMLGIMSGDRIISIDDTSAIGYTNEDVMSRLRGEKGTPVDVEIVRPRNPNVLKYTIIRDNIPLTTVDAHYKLDERTGYIKINRFAATTHEEFLASASDLIKDGMERLVLDLRNNPGGYLSQAIAISEEFFPKGTKLVSTQSRHTRFNSEVYSRRDGVFKDFPVIVLVNEGSASASEIVSGAIQDHDRGLIVGRRTFGKGLVQQQYELVDKSNVRVTISRYYTPSGRLIQKPFDGDNEDYVYEISHRTSDPTMDAQEFRDQVPDSLHYKTTAGRDVFGGGGIVPDIIVQDDITNNYYLFNFMIINRIDFEFVREYLDKNGEEFRDRWEDDYQEFRTDFTWTDADKEHFLELMADQGLVIDSEYEEITVEENELFMSQETYNELVELNYGRMRAELARMVWGNEYFYPINNDYLNESLHAAMELWDIAEKLDLFVQGKASNLPDFNRNRN